MDFSTEARDHLQDAFGATATHVVRAPGRVNLIGEHVDYAHMPVLPIAIDRALWVAVAPSDEPLVRAVSSAFPKAVSVGRENPSASAAGWDRYVAGVVRHLHDLAPGRGAVVAVTGDLPLDGGLSSSSALSTGLTAALAAAWDVDIDRESVARRAADAERTVGVETGGMDQQVIAFAEAGAALHIGFAPLQRRHVPLPPGLDFVVASSGVESPKGGAAKDAYNERVMGMRLATALLSERLGVDPPTPLRLGDIADIDVVELLVDDLPPTASAKEVSRLARIPIAKLARFTSGSWDISKPVPVRAMATHIFEESARVSAAEAALSRGDLKAFGKLLTESHGSLRDNVRCSTPELDSLCAAMRKAGAFGARLTGAGFGGYALAACPPEFVDAVTDAARARSGGSPAFTVRASAGYALA